MFAPDQARRTIFWMQTLIAGRKSRERERERERDCTVFAHESFILAWFLRISKRNVWVSQSILLQLLPMRTQNPNLSCASAFVRHSRTFYSINALRTFHRMHTFLNCLNTIRVWSGSKPCLHIPSADRHAEREREREVFLLNFVRFCCFFYSGNSFTYFKVSVDLCKKIWSFDMSSGFNSWVQY